MREFFIASLREMLVSDTWISKLGSEAVGRRRLRKSGSRLSTRNLTQHPLHRVRRNG